MTLPSLPAPPPIPAETVDLAVAMEGLSHHTRRAYVRHIKAYLAAYHRLKPKQIDIYHLSTSFAVAALSPLTLRKHLGLLKTRGLSGNTIAQVRTAVIWLGDLLADLGRANRDLPGALRRVKLPAAETGQRVQTWLTAEEIKAILLAVPEVKGITPAAAARNLAIVTLIATTGLRCGRISSEWAGIGRCSYTAKARRYDTSNCRAWHSMR